MYSKMNRVGNGFKMGRWEVGFLQVGAWVFIGGCLVVNLVHEESEVEFVHAVSAGGSVKFLPAE